MKAWFVPPIVIPATLLLAMVAIWAFRTYS